MSVCFERSEVLCLCCVCVVFYRIIGVNVNSSSQRQEINAELVWHFLGDVKRD